MVLLEMVLAVSSPSVSAFRCIHLYSSSSEALTSLFLSLSQAIRGSSRSLPGRWPSSPNASSPFRPSTSSRFHRLNQNVTQSKPDHHEGLDLYAPSPFPPSTSTPIPPLAGENQWPQKPSTFRATMEDWIEKMHVLGMAVMEA